MPPIPAKIPIGIPMTLNTDASYNTLRRSCFLVAPMEDVSIEAVEGFALVEIRAAGMLKGCDCGDCTFGECEVACGHNIYDLELLG